MLKMLQRNNRLREAYKKVFSGPDGELVLHDILEKSHMFSPSYVSANDGLAGALETALREGERNVALRIVTILRYNSRDTLRLNQQQHDQLEMELEDD